MILNFIEMHRGVKEFWKYEDIFLNMMNPKIDR